MKIHCVKKNRYFTQNCTAREKKNNFNNDPSVESGKPANWSPFFTHLFH